MSSLFAPQWNSKTLLRKSEPLVNDVPYTRAIQTIDSMKESTGMKHLLAQWVTSLRLRDKKIPEKMLSRKKSTSFLDSARETIEEDLGKFRISGMIMMICATLVCLFIRSVILNTYLINFSVDAIIGVLAFAGLLLNLSTSMQTVGLYGSTRDFWLLDGAAAVLWFLLLILFPQFDTSLLLFLLTYFIERRKLKLMVRTFLKDNQIPLDLDQK